MTSLNFFEFKDRVEHIFEGSDSNVVRDIELEKLFKKEIDDKDNIEEKLNYSFDNGYEEARCNYIGGIEHDLNSLKKKLKERFPLEKDIDFIENVIDEIDYTDY